MNRFRQSYQQLILLLLLSLSLAGTATADTTALLATDSLFLETKGCLLTATGTLVSDVASLNLRAGEQISFSNFGTTSYKECSKGRTKITNPVFNKTSEQALKIPLGQKPKAAPRSLPPYVFLETD